MEIKKFEMCLDGGTIKLTTDKGIFCFDERIKSSTKGRLYDGYPKDDNSNLIENSVDLEQELIEQLKLFKSDFYQSSIDYFINSNKNNISVNEVEFCNCGNPSGGHHCYVDENIIECADCGKQLQN